MNDDEKRDEADRLWFALRRLCLADISLLEILMESDGGNVEISEIEKMVDTAICRVMEKSEALKVNIQ